MVLHRLPYLTYLNGPDAFYMPFNRSAHEETVKPALCLWLSSRFTSAFWRRIQRQREFWASRRDLPSSPVLDRSSWRRKSRFLGPKACRIYTGSPVASHLVAGTK
ncbi:uncharacterized [Tachysurus ichikawai]